MKRIGKNLLFAIAMIFTLSMVAPEVVPITTATTVEAASVKLNYRKIALYKGQKKKLRLKGTKKKAKWSSNRKTVVSVDKKGKITAKKKGTAVITAKVGKKKYKCRVTVKVKAAVKKPTNTKPIKKPTNTKPAKLPTLVKEINLDKKDITLTVGQTQKLTAKFTPANATNKSVRWSSDAPKVATVDSNGNVKAVSEGIAGIWVNKSDNYGFGVDYCLVTVKKAPDIVTKNFESLKNYILNNGMTNSSGNKFIRFSSDNNIFGIAYDGQGFDFIFTQDDNGVESSIAMYIKSPNKSNLYPEYIIIFKDYGESAVASTSLSPSNYEKNDRLYFNVSNSTGYINNSNVQNAANSALRLAFTGWDILVSDQVGMKLSDLGFTSYK